MRPPESLVVEDVPSPAPGPGEAVITVKAASVNFPDVLIIENKYQVKPPLPFSPGSELAGVVKAVGDGVTACKPGDRVMAITGYGAFAEEVKTEARRLLAIPAGMDFATAAAFGLTYATSEHALVDRGALKAGETLLVLGAAGGVGLAAIEIGKILGARVIACASTDDKLAVCRAHGADETINYATEDLRERIKALTGGNGADVVYDPVGGAVHRARAALDRLARPAARRRLRGGRHPEDSAEPDAAQGLLDRRRVLGRLGAPRAASTSPRRWRASTLVRGRQTQAAHLRDVPARARGRRADPDGVAKGDRQGRADMRVGLMPFVLAAAVVTGPITGGDHGQPFSAMPPAELTQAAYTEAEYFFGGTATAFKPTGPLGMDGVWKVAPDTTADYKVRMLVRRPPTRRNSTASSSSNG